MQKTKRNLRVKWNGETVVLKNVPVDYFGNTYYGGAALSAKLIRELILKPAKKAGLIDKYWAKSETFSMGNAVNIYLWSVDGVDVDVYEDIEAQANRFQAGHFNGMIDMYEYNHENQVVVEVIGENTKFSVSAKFVSTSRRAPWGSKEYGRDDNIYLQDLKKLAVCRSEIESTNDIDAINSSDEWHKIMRRWSRTERQLNTTYSLETALAL